MKTSRKRSGGGGGKIDPSSLHLRKESTQNRKGAAKVATQRSPICSARTLAKHLHNNGEIDGIAIAALSVGYPLEVQSNVDGCSCCTNGVCGNATAKETDRSVFLCNRRSRKSESEVSKLITEDDGEDSKGQPSFSTRDDDNSFESYPSGVFTCKNANFAASICSVNKSRLKKKTNYTGTGFRCHNGRLGKQRRRRSAVDVSPGFGIGRDSMVSLTDLSDGSEDLRNTTTALRPRLGNKGQRHSPVFSKSSCNKYGMESYDAITGSSFNDGDDEVDEDQLGLPGCGIPCYWSRRSTPKSRVWYGSCYSPSQSVHQRHQHHHRRSNKRRLNSRITCRSVANVPLLGRGRSSIISAETDEDPLINFEELDMEASSRLDGMRLPLQSTRQGGLELEHKYSVLEIENVGSISHKYRPMFSGDLVGQHTVLESLSNAISRGRIAPIYLFQGPSGTGKTSTARIFAAALNCLSINTNTKPCGVCRECVEFVSGKSRHFIEVHGSDRNGIKGMKNVLKSVSMVHQFKVFALDECDLLPAKKWLAVLRILKKPMANVVIILRTTDTEYVPHAVLSRCQKHIFNRITSGDIVTRLAKIAAAENFEVEVNALDLIAMHADGSLREAEAMLDQLSLLGKRIDISMVNELVGVVSDGKLLNLLASAMSPNAAETVRKARELIDSGVDPIVLMSRMAGIIVDIIAGTYPSIEHIPVSERELDQLKHALVSLSEAEKHLRGSSDCSTWFTATLLQLGSSAASPEITDAAFDRNLNEIWLQCLEKCHSKTLQQLLRVHGKLVSISEAKGRLLVHIAFVDKSIKLRAEGFLSSITNSLEVVLQQSVEVRIALLPEPTHRSQSDKDESIVSVSDAGDPDPNTCHGPMQARIDSFSMVHQHRMETAWKQAVAKKPETDHILCRDHVPLQSRNSTDVRPSQNHWEDELCHELNALKLNNGIVSRMARRLDQAPIPPCSLHSSSFASNFHEENIKGYESGSGAPCCSGIFCWNDSKQHQDQQGRKVSRRRRFPWL
ncbi:protein STICHEL-like [Andrographis paniculata]|uniref:protein STICHEL-like n=1 Tax=Andrographis paniculata TaxID=175694 RepID=UPI0021E89FF3|nr:protein STICHEL-like [Andrographis paniculata]